jgi:hypothetical protein
LFQGFEGIEIEGIIIAENILQAMSGLSKSKNALYGLLRMANNIVTIKLPCWWG